jgi:hypothetical protein
VLPRKGHVRQRLGDPLPHQRRRLGQTQPLQLLHHLLGLALGRVPVLLGVDGLEHGRHLLDLRRRHRREHVAVKVDRTTLPTRLRVELRQRLHQPQALVADEQFHPLQAAALEVTQEGGPTVLVLFGPLQDAQDLAVAQGVDPHGHQHGHVAHLAPPAALQPDAIQEDVGVLPFDGAVAPGLDVTVDLLVQLADRTGADPGAPQGLGDVLDAAGGHAGQVHLDQSLLHRGLAAAVAFDDGRLERQIAQLRHVQLHLTGLGLELAGVVAGAGVEPVGGALVTLGAAEFVGLGVEEGIEGLLHGVADDAVQVLVDLLVVDLDHG